MNICSLLPRPARAQLSGAAFVAALSIGSACHAAIPPVERLLPDDTLIVLTVPDFGKLREIYTNSPQTRFWNDPAMQPFKEKFVSKFKEDLVQPLERELGVRLEDYTGLPQGQLTFAVTQNDGPDADAGPAWLFLLDTKENSGQLQTNLTELRRKWVDAGKPIRSESVRGVDFSVFMISEKDMPQALKNAFAPVYEGEDGQPEVAAVEEETNGTPRSELVIGQYESLLIIGNSTRPVEKVMVHLTGGSMPALSDLAAFEANRLAMFRDAPIYAWVNVKTFMDQLRGKAEDAGEAASPFAMLNPARILEATGLGSLRTLAVTFQNSPEGSAFELFIGVPESTRRGLFKILPTGGKESGPPPFVPADIAKFQRWRVDGQKAWSTLLDVLDEISPQARSGINMLLDTANMAAREKDPDFDVRKNLFGNLGDDVITYEKAPRGGTAAQLSSAPSLVLIGSPQPEQLASALKSVLVFLSRQGGTPDEREFLGRKIYSVPMPAGLIPMAAAPRGARPQTLHYSSSGGYVALSTDASMVEEYLRSSNSQQKTLRETPGITEAAARVGGSSTGIFGFENQSETTRAMFEALKGSSGTNAASLFPGGNRFQEWMDFSLLPTFDRVSKYFHYSVYATSANVDGVTFKLFAPTPPELR